MKKRVRFPRLVIASHNAGKIAEIKELLGPYITDLTSAHDLNLPEPQEDGTTFHDNARIKALTVATLAKAPALADDSGLEVAALDGAPGVQTSRWAGDKRDYTAAMKKIHEKIGKSKDRRAAFVCVLALATAEGDVQFAEGRIEGKICWPPRGKGGFGYDPFFIPEGYDQTFAELDPAIKHKISHRGRAFQKLIKQSFA